MYFIKEIHKQFKFNISNMQISNTLKDLIEISSSYTCIGISNPWISQSVFLASNSLKCCQCARKANMFPI